VDASLGIDEKEKGRILVKKTISLTKIRKKYNIFK
jgi:hypothetical protein